MYRVSYKRDNFLAFAFPLFLDALYLQFLFTQFTHVLFLLNDAVTVYCSFSSANVNKFCYYTNKM